MRSLITGIGGFAGGHLAAALLEREEEVAGYTLPCSSYPQLEFVTDRIALVEGDILDGESLRQAFDAFRPEVVFHLAAITHVARAWQRRRQTLEVNIIGTATVLDAASDLEPRPRVIVASSGQVYGAGTTNGPPFSEPYEPRPLGPYATSKRCAEILAFEAWTRDSLPTVVVRTFNFTGPWQSPDFVCSDFARQVARAEAGLAPAEICVGDLEARRDFSDVRDIVDGYLLAAESGKAGAVYNLASGHGIRIAEILEQLLEMSRVPIEVRQDPQRLRPAEIPALVGDPSLARQELGWAPQIPWDDTLASVLDFWREKTGGA